METARPLEACGLLIGTMTSSEHVVIRIAPIENLASGEGAFELEPSAWHRAELAAREEGLAVLGVWHSHPKTSAEPSARDLTGAQAGWSHLICAAKGESAFRSYYSLAGELLEKELH